MEVLADFKMSVGAPFYNLSFAPLFVLLLLAVPFGPMLAWKRGDLLGVTQRLLAAGVASLVVIAIVWAWTRGGSALAPLAIGLGVFVIAGAADRSGRTNRPVSPAIRDVAAPCPWPAALGLGHARSRMPVSVSR